MENLVICPKCAAAAKKFQFEFNCLKNYKAYQCQACHAIFFRQKRAEAIRSEKYKTKI